jgi:hypothetical protein
LCLSEHIKRGMAWLCALSSFLGSVHDCAPTVSAYLPTALLFTITWSTPGQKEEREPAYQCLSKDLHILGCRRTANRGRGGPFEGGRGGHLWGEDQADVCSLNKKPLCQV